MIVVDANVIASAFTRVEGHAAAREALDHDEDWKVPILWRVEYLSALRWAIFELGATLDAAEAAYDEAVELFGHRELPVDPRRILEISSLKRKLSVYDAHYLVLAHELGCSVVTEHRKFAAIANDAEIVKVVGEHRVLLVEDYIRCPHRAFTPSAMRACSPACGDRASRRLCPRRRPRPPTSPTGHGPPAHTVRGRSSWRAPSPWTSSPVPPAKGA